MCVIEKNLAQQMREKHERCKKAGVGEERWGVERFGDWLAWAEADR